MADLSTISASNPAGSETPTLGDNRIRALADAIITSFFVEHALSGEHKIGIGALADRPAVGNEGRLWILTVVGLEPVLQYDDGESWITLTELNAIADIVADLAAHVASNPIGHADASITYGKIAAGAIRLKHLVNGSSDPASIAALVSGGSADSLHSHAQYDADLIGDGDIQASYLSASVAGAGGIIRGQANTERTIVDVAYVKYKEIAVNWAGAYTVSFTLFAAGGGVSGSTVYGRVYKNGYAIGTERICVAGGGVDPDVTLTYTEAFTFAVDDLVQIYAYLGAGSVNGTVKDFRLLSQWETTINQD